MNEIPAHKTTAIGKLHRAVNTGLNAEITSHEALALITALTAAPASAEPVGWRWDQATNEGDWQTAFTEYGEPVPSPTVHNVTPLYSQPQPATNGEALTRALDFIESLTADPLLMGVDDIEMTLEDVQDHARIELASIRRIVERSGDYYRQWLANKGPEEAVPLTPTT